jgi:DNA repair protein RadD
MEELFQPAQIAAAPTFTPRPYQADSISAAVKFFNGTGSITKHGLIVLPTGSGKSIVIANIAKELEGKTIVFQPSKEILEQNYAKFRSYGFRASIYSASAGQKRIDKVTFATIGSVAKKHYLFKEFKNIIIDECHLVNSQGGMYHDFIHAIDGCKVLGLTATPYRLYSTMEGAMLKFLTRTRPRIFSDVLYIVQNSILFDAGFLAKLKYYSFDVIDRKMLQMNSAGSDYTAASLKRHYQQIDMPRQIAYWTWRLLQKRKNILIFCALIEEASAAARLIDGAVVITGETEKSKREKILSDFKANRIKCLINVGVLTTGFDYPELECVLIARSTMSLSLYYQIVGRAMRIHPDKSESWIVDLGGNINFFGKIETMKIERDVKGLYTVVNNGRYLTNVTFSK